MFRIGDFSRLARVTIKTLHHYDEAGLLQPLHVDEQSGYRYYAASQLQTLHRILLLKDLGFALEQIRELLHSDAESLAAVLDKRRQDLVDTIAADQSRLRRLEALQLSIHQRGDVSESSVLLRDSPAIEVYSVRQRVRHFGTPMQMLFEEAEAVVASAHARHPASPFTIFHDLDYREQDVDVEVCIPVKRGTRLTTRVLPPCEATASISYQGPYEQTPVAYSLLLEWLSRSGMRLAALAIASGSLVHANGIAAEARETHPNITTSYGTLTLRDGVKLQTIVTKPAAASGRLPAIMFVQWLSCDTVAISDHPRDGWSAMLKQIVRRSNALVWRTEKRGAGASEGTCATMDYNTELDDHRQALAQLRARDDVDPNRIVIYGGSIGGTYAPLLAADQSVAGVMIWGAGSTTWAERMLKFERNALELGGTPSPQLAHEMTLRLQFFEKYLIRGQSPSQISKADPDIGAVWPRIVGTSADGHYGRPFAFHQQAQQADWAAAWSKVNAPVLALYGEYDWFESRDATSLIARIVNAKTPGRGTFVEIPRMNHHFAQYPSATAAFAEQAGQVDAEPAVSVMLAWLQRIFAAR